MKIMLLNGPPSSGKDTAAVAIQRQLTAQFDVIISIDRLSMPIKRAFAGTVDIPIDNLGNVKYFESIKETPLTILNGKSYRQWQIDFSEKFMKPLYGEDIFARLLIDRIKTYLAQHGIPDILIIPDCGFQIELDTLVTELNPKHITLFHLVRPGTDWSKDSRGYVSHPEIRIHEIHNTNKSTFESLMVNIAKGLLDE